MLHLRLVARFSAIICLWAWSSKAPAAPAVDSGGAGGTVADLQAWLRANPGRDAALPDALLDRKLTKEEARAVADLLVQARRDRLRSEKSPENEISIAGVTMRYESARFDDAADDTPRSLFISMHGGGGAPARLNDSQWRNQVALARAYRPRHAVYIAPRAPTNDWDLWHKEHIDPLFDRLIERAVTFDHVDPNRVYLMGYSAGGDGVFQLAPRMADRFAAAAMMAGHPNEAQPLGLRNLPFTIHVGALDAAYERNKVAPAWGRRIEELRKADPGGYESWTSVHENLPHWMNTEDKAAIPWMQKFQRNPLPTRVVWHQDNVTHQRFYWLAVPPGEARKDDIITAERDGQTIRITTSRPMRVLIRANDAMLDLDQPIEIERDGKRHQVKPTRTVRCIAKTLAERGDAALTFSAEVEAP
jgi:predicted esterase